MHWAYVGLALAVCLYFCRLAAADQSGLKPGTDMRSPALKFQGGGRRPSWDTGPRDEAPRHGWPCIRGSGSSPPKEWRVIGQASGLPVDSEQFLRNQGGPWPFR